MNKKAKNILVCVAWPYVNGEPHLGHIAGNNLPADIFARFHRMIGNNVLMVSGSDQHGTPVTLRAKKEGVSPSQIAEKFHKIWSDIFLDMNFSFDLYTKTGTDNHAEVVQELFKNLLKNDLLVEKTTKQPYSEKSSMFLSDRYIIGNCPYCSEKTRGDQCEKCGKNLDPEDLTNLESAIDGSKLIFKETNHMYLKLSKFQNKIEEWVKNKSFWKPSVKNQTMSFLDKGLIDRAITRDIEWGVEVPIEGYENKRIYVWFEAVIGYLSASIEWAKSSKNKSGNMEIWKEWWINKDSKHFYFQGKDNIPFHTIILPSILLGSTDYNLPYDIVANEYLNFSGKQFSKSKNWAVWVSEFLEKHDSEALRYYLSSIMPETSDSDFTWKSFYESNNNELVATFGNLVNRIESLIRNNFHNIIPEPKELSKVDQEIIEKVKLTFTAAHKHLSNRQFRNALKSIMLLAQEGNKYIDLKAPWKEVKEDMEKASNTLWVGANIISNLGVLMSPFLPKTSEKISRLVSKNPSELIWKFREINPGTELNPQGTLFKKIDIQEEIKKLL